jgi:hypothetical protein
LIADVFLWESFDRSKLD